MGAALLITNQVLAGYFHGTLVAKVLALSLLIATGMGVYTALLFSMHVLKVVELREYFRKR
jgi:hypothetical protein